MGDLQVEQHEPSFDSRSSGMDFFRAAFNEEEKPPEVPPSPTGATTGEVPPSPTGAEAEGEIDQVGTQPQQPDTDALVEAEVARRENERRAQAEALALREWLDSLPPDQYGQIVRNQEREAAARAQAQEEALATFYSETIQGLASAVPELSKLSAEEAKRIDPNNAKSYADYIGQLVDVAADKRAGERAKKLAEKETAARVTQEMKRVQQEYPRQPLGGGGASGGDRVSVGDKGVRGLDLIRQGLSDKE